MSAAWLFPGQGSHSLGMSMAWAERSPEARAVLDASVEILGGDDLPALMAEGPFEELHDTYNQQPSLLIAGVAIMRAAAEEIPAPAFVAGHSLGEYTAYVAAGAMSYEDALRLVRTRARLMKEAGDATPGGMAAILGLPDERVEAVCRELEGVQVANYNAPGQVVISGERPAVDAAGERLKEAGAKRVIPVRITVAAHSHLMAACAARFNELADATPVQDARVPVIANVTAEPITAAADIHEEMRRQLTSGVRWTDTIERMIAEGVTDFYEVGPGSVLSGMVKRVLRGHPDVEARVLSLAEPD